MGLLNPSSWSKQGLAEWTYNTLDPVYGEGAPLEEVTEQVRQGDIVGAGFEAVENVLVEPVIDYTVESVVTPVVAPVVDIGLQYVEPVKDAVVDGLETGKDIATVGLVVGALYFLSR